MYTFKIVYPWLPFIFFAVLIMYACNDSEKMRDGQIVSDPEQMDRHVGENIKAALEVAADNNSKINDSTQLVLMNAVGAYYNSNQYTPVWSKKEKWQPLADSLYEFIIHGEWHGLFPKDYHFKNLYLIKTRLDTDSLSRMDATLWARADLMLTDGFMHIISDLKQGRLQPDSVSLNKDSTLLEDFFISSLNTLLEKKNFTGLINSLQPIHKGYWELKKGIRHFLDSMDRTKYTYVPYPYKKGDPKDSVYFIKTLQKRLYESGCIDFIHRLPDTAQLRNAIKKYQAKKEMKADGKISAAFIRILNTNDVERFKRIAVTLDKYKQMPAKMPDRYIWVNIPGYYLWVVNRDSIILESKTICGKPETRTPLLTSQISDMITYPTWTVPNSIIVKQYLPRLKNNPGYLSRIGLKLLNGKGEIVDPYSVNWSKYSKGIPYKVVQGSGDDNSLGVIKFNFNNPYAVYLHDTNQRYLFKNSSRALSHGCVRVQEWQKLAFYIARNDSIQARKSSVVLKYNTDSIRHWLANKQHRRIDVKNHLPLFIRYFSCEGKAGKIKFYEDVYNEDKLLRDKYFANK